MVGLSWRAILLDGTQPIALGPFTRGLGWSREQVETRLVEVRKGYMDEGFHIYAVVYNLRTETWGGNGHGYGAGRDDMNREDHSTRVQLL
jgi:hypothetical protein